MRLEKIQCCGSYQYYYYKLKSIDRWCTYHFVPTPDKDSYSSGVFTLFNDQHSLLRCAETELPNNASMAQFVCSQFLKAGDNTATSGNSNQLEVKKGRLKNEQQ